MPLPCFQYHCWLVSHIGWWNVTNEASYKNPGRGDERWFRGSWLSVSVPLCSTAGAGNPGDRWEVDLLTLLSWSDAQRNAHTHRRLSVAADGAVLLCPMWQLPRSDAPESWQPKMTQCLPPPHESFAEIARIPFPVARFACGDVNSAVTVGTGPIAFVSISLMRYSRWRCKRNCSWSVFSPKQAYFISKFYYGRPWHFMGQWRCMETAVV